jgi:hypothetical protein
LTGVCGMSVVSQTLCLRKESRLITPSNIAVHLPLSHAPRVTPCPVAFSNSKTFPGDPAVLLTVSPIFQLTHLLPWLQPPRLQNLWPGSATVPWSTTHCVSCCLLNHLTVRSVVTVTHRQPSYFTFASLHWIKPTVLVRTSAPRDWIWLEKTMRPCWWSYVNYLSWAANEP